MVKLIVFCFIFSQKLKDTKKKFTSHIFIEHKITTLMQTYIYKSTDLIHCYEHFSQYSLKEYCELQHLVFD